MYWILGFRNKNMTTRCMLTLISSSVISRGRPAREGALRTLYIPPFAWQFSCTRYTTSKQSNLFWVNMESKHPCDGVPLLFSELSDARRHRKIAIVGRGGQIIGEEIWGEYF